MLSGALTAVTMTSCGHRSGSADSDSAAAEESVSAEAGKPAEPEHLPDTAFASAEELKYEVTVLDTTVSDRLDNLRDLYAGAPGILTFRGGPKSDTPFAGKIDAVPSKITTAWRFTTGSDKIWRGGTGWTGQPLVVTWPDAQARKLKESGAVNSNFTGTEIIVGSLDGHVYFLNPDNGKPTRRDIDTGNPIKGTVSLDPILNGYLYVGQGIPNQEPFGAYTIDLFRNEIISRFGRDPKAYRGWDAYDSSAIRVGQFVFRPGENGTLYKWLPGSDGMKLHSTLRYTSGKASGIESSLAVWLNYGYFGDNSGNIICVNLDTMKPVWHYDNHDDTDASPIIAEENGKVYLYTGCEIDKQKEGAGYLVKLDALTGAKVWENTYPGRSYESPDEKHFNGGYYATPLLGKGDCGGIIFANVVSNRPNLAGDIMAVDRQSGKTLWKTALKTYAWSSPVALMGPHNEMYIVTGDTAGRIYVIKGKTGEILLCELTGANFESSPIIIGNSIYVGSRGDSIYKITIS